MKILIILQLTNDDIGQIGGGKVKPTGIVDIAMVQSLNSREKVNNLLKDYGQVVVDECHHISAVSFEKVMKQVDAKYVHGLTATPQRKDGLHPIITMQCGPIRYKVEAKQQAKVYPFKQVLIPRYTSFHVSDENNEMTIHHLYKNMVNDERRNEMIFNDVLHCLEEGRSPIILTERIEHIKKLEEKFKDFAKNVIVLTGGLKKKEEQERLQQLKRIPENEERLIIASGKYIGEGFDDARLDTLFLAMPISWKGTLQQYVGRLHRHFVGKSSVKVYDYIDHKQPMIKKMYEKRLKGYAALGFKTLNNDETKDEQMKLF
ncbi:DEAD/DEAH box helicase family protein [Bacillus shivajii]|uniref:DEAD/DEAH box helicase n=1 Tax=Bacillus shivajii TaxID=1983719 RepID=UPI001CFABC6A|nr:DEAD/DEAH box helicase family protein [Bacillus shivajii]UCZ53998.1 DEAD/DEAH box helicase family protein [Bacillus shivajii]